MAQFRTTADLLDLALHKAGEVTSGTSSYETDALGYMNMVHLTLIAGGTIPLGKDQTIEIDEVWPWAKSRSPLILELQPKYDTGTVTLTLGSESGTFSSAPATSLRGWHLKAIGRSERFKIAEHTAGATAFELDGPYPDATGTTLLYEAFKVDYDLIPDYIVIDLTNNKLQFQEAAGTTLTATLSAGTYTPDQLATQIATQLGTSGGTPAYTVTYSAITRKFTIASDRAAGSVFVLVGTGTASEQSAHKTLGFDDVDSTNAASVTSTYPLGGLCRLIEPIKIHKGSSGTGNIYGIDSESFQRNYPFALISEGIPDRFSVISEAADGTFTVRFNRYPTEKTRVEVEHTPLPRDLKDSSASIPLVPRKWIDILVTATTFYLMLDKSDDRAPMYSQLLTAKLSSMISQFRGSLVRTGGRFGQIISRRDNMGSGKRRLTYGYDGND